MDVDKQEPGETRDPVECPKNAGCPDEMEEFGHLATTQEIDVVIYSDQREDGEEDVKGDEDLWVRCVGMRRRVVNRLGVWRL